MRAARFVAVVIGVLGVLGVLGGCTTSAPATPTGAVSSGAPVTPSAAVPEPDGQAPTATADPDPDPLPPTDLEALVLPAMAAAGITEPGAAEINYGDVAMLMGSWADGAVSVGAYADPEFVPPATVEDPVDIGGLTATIVGDASGAGPSVRFVCGDVTYEVRAFTADLTPLHDVGTAVDAATALRGQLTC